MTPEADNLDARLRAHYRRESLDPDMLVRLRSLAGVQQHARRRRLPTAAIVAAAALLLATLGPRGERRGPAHQLAGKLAEMPPYSRREPVDIADLGWVCEGFEKRHGRPPLICPNSRILNSAHLWL